MKHTKKGWRQDQRRISLKQRHERRYWTRKLGVTLERLRAAVAQVGVSAERVRNYMQTDTWAFPV